MLFENLWQISLAPYYDVETAADGKAGLDKIDEFLPDLVISDITMPEMR